MWIKKKNYEDLQARLQAATDRNAQLETERATLQQALAMLQQTYAEHQ